ncbi:MAG TPA: leucine--tRNA ligase [Bacteroidales bacterium]|nr:leucine--tRNA ligase [Bacteroidales bacterium]
MDYNFAEIEKKWQQYWSAHKTFKADADNTKPKYYVLDMFPYPSGAGLHVGHPLGYIASDIFARYKRLKGFNVLHPMGYDAFGLPAEQYAIQTGQHPAVTTENNIARYREQLDKMGFSFDWDREVRTSDPKYYKWTQWTFIKLFQTWYNKKTDKAEPIDDLIAEFESCGSSGVQAACSPFAAFDAAGWNAFSEKEKRDMLMNFRLAYFADSIVNWCPALGCVLANDEVADGFSVRGGHPVVRKTMKQWLLRIAAYADRLLNGLDIIDWPDSIKEIQRNWIGRSEGAMIKFPVKGHEDLFIEVFTTRPDTIFGVTYLTLAPEHEYVNIISTPDRKAIIDHYITETKNRSERERIADVKRITGEFTGAFAVNPFTREEVPVWVGDYVLAGYGTGAVMAVPAHDSRDWAFANHFGLPLKEVISGGEITKEAFESKEGKCINSGFINSLSALEGAKAVIAKAEETGIGYRKINYRLRDAIFSRQRYWGEPFPVYYRDGIPSVLDESELPLELPAVDAYLPTVTGEPPLARAKNWKTKEGYPLETNTMPGFAGSSAYYLRYMDPHNDREYFSKEANHYWENVDLYIGGAEHATGHLMYSRFWNKFLFDLGLACKDEPFKKLINQGMIQGRSSYVYRIKGTNKFVSLNLKNNYETDSLLVDINMVNNDILDTNEFKTWRPDLADAEFILEDGKYVCGSEVEKMSKSKYNIVSPDDLIEKYGADTLRLYEMFLGPIEQHKPWDTKGIEGVFRFIRKLWRLYHDQGNNFTVSDEQPTKEELKVLHKTIKKVQEDIERFSFNTAVSTFMICVNELSDLKCNKRAILCDLAIILSPYAPHISEELWCLLGNKESISKAAFPEFNHEYIVENTCTYAVSFNGKMRFTLELPVDMPVSDIEKTVLEHKDAEKWLTGKSPRKVIVVPGKIINIVV